MQNTFYDRLDYYRMLSAGMSNIAEVAAALKVSVRTLERWKMGYDPEKGPYGSISDISVVSREDSKYELLDRFGGQEFVADKFVADSKCGTRGEIVNAVRRAALDGNVQAAKLLLTVYENMPEDGEDFLTVDRAVELLREWTQKG